ncbi:MAG TPA: citrate (Si)-synthase [Candidatus Polarisedimenticolia bacterium]|nr:citrate (Si)-synthase [Candidatus Polarisedimenticolia bacterium]
MAKLKNKLAGQIPSLRSELHALAKEHGGDVVSEVTVNQVLGGMRGVKGLLCDTSVVQADKGLIVRNIPIADLADRIPEEIFYLLVTGELPDASSLADFQNELRERAEVPSYVWEILNDMPRRSHPMTMFSTAILVMERESDFRKRYSEGMHKDEYWEPTLEDSLQLIAKLPAIGAGIYRLHTGKGDLVPSDPKLDWGGNFAHMLGIPDPTGEFANLIRLYLTLHCDHEGGNVSAFTCQTVGSALSDPYYAVSAGMNGLAGPLHGLANQECLHFVLSVRSAFKGVPSDEDLSQFVWKTLNEGHVIPGYGHAVLRVTDPRFTAFHEFGARVCGNDEIFKIIDAIYRVVPSVLREQGKAKDPWPNVDAISGSLLYHFGLTEFDFYTVLFGVSRALGMCSQLIINRALGMPITRPKSVSTDWLQKTVSTANRVA